MTNLKYWRLTGMFYLLIMVYCGCAVSTLLRSHASSLLIPTWSGLLKISPLVWTSTHRYLRHFNSEFNPLTPNIHRKIHQTDLHTFPQRLCWENLIKDPKIDPKFFITFSLDDIVLISSDEIWCWTLVEPKGLTISFPKFNKNFKFHLRWTMQSNARTAKEVSFGWCHSGTSSADSELNFSVRS